jgi:endonuclease/exonuclease/phosphatase family metal-dependent hydrolase
MFVVLVTACTVSSQLTPSPAPSSATAPSITRTDTPTPAFALPTLTLPPTLTPSPTSTPTPLLNFKALSYNILYGAGVDRIFDAGVPIALVGKNRLPELLSFIKRADPDILGIQEANAWDAGTPPVIQQVAQELGMNYFLATTPSGFNLGLLTKFQILETENLSSEIGRQGALRVKLRAPSGETLNVFVSHLDPASSDTRLCEVESLVRQMQPYTARGTILLGDMNFQRSSREFLKLEQAGWQSVAVEKSWGIDQVWMSPFAKWSSTAWYDSLTLPSGVSDHAPIGAEISIYPGLVTIPTPPEPTATIQSSSVVLDALEGLQISRSDPFDDPCTFSRWNSRWKTEKFTNGRLEIAGEESWQAFASRYKQFSEGQGVILRFQFAKGSEFGIHFDNTAWNTGLYRRFGINVRDEKIRSTTWQGPTEIRLEDLSGNLDPAPDTWYNLLLALGRNGDLKVMVWDPARPSRTLQYRVHMGEQWTVLPWILEVGANKGSVWVDDFSEISFSAIK